MIGRREDSARAVARYDRHNLRALLRERQKARGVLRDGRGPGGDERRAGMGVATARAAEERRLPDAHEPAAVLVAPQSIRRDVGVDDARRRRAPDSAVAALQAFDEHFGERSSEHRRDERRVDARRGQRRGFEVEPQQQRVRDAAGGEHDEPPVVGVGEGRAEEPVRRGDDAVAENLCSASESRSRLRNLVVVSCGRRRRRRHHRGDPAWTSTRGSEDPLVGGSARLLLGRPATSDRRLDHRRHSADT
mmetsp:Transcript_18295/g.73147  ORF Transcript_18295/g.73147 Transcript_18295/m.73147 type:complete len:248 (+) Transcript_18295:2242-2985(+)